MDNILIIDNYSSNTKILVMMLRQMGYSVRSAANVEAALQSMEKCKPQMILIDVDLSDSDGYKTCEIIKAEKKYEKSLLFLSAPLMNLTEIKYLQPVVLII